MQFLRGANGVMIMSAACLTSPLQANEESALSADMSFLEYLGSMVEVRGELVDPLEVYGDLPENAGRPDTQGQNILDTTTNPETTEVAP